MSGKHEESVLHRAVQVLDAMEAAGWDMDDARHKAKIAKEAYNHATRKYHNQRYYNNTVRMPTRVLSNIINLDDYLGIGDKWCLGTIASELDGDKRRGAPGVTADTIVVPAPMVIDLVDAFERAVDKMVRQAIEREVIAPEHLDRFKDQIERELKLRAEAKNTRGNFTQPGARLIESFEEFTDVFGGSAEKTIMDAMEGELGREIDRELVGDTKEYTKRVERPAFMGALACAADVRGIQDGWAATVAVDDLKRNWRFQIGPFAWSPALAKVEYRVGLDGKPDQVAVTVAARDSGSGKLPDVGAMLDRAIQEERPVCAELRRENGGPASWYWGAKANIERLRTGNGQLHLTLVTDVAYIAHGNPLEVEEASIQFRKEECGQHRPRLGGALPTF